MAKSKPNPSRKGDMDFVSIPVSQLSQTEDIPTKLERATKLEQKLSSITATNGSQCAASEIRAEICTIMSDVILADCTHSLRKDVTGRLWRHCFYGRINELRNRIHKDRVKLRRLQQKGVVAVQDLQVLKDRLKKTEGNLKVFIDEAVALYTYLIDQLQGMLLPNLTCKTQSPSQTQSSQESAGTLAKKSIDEGVVPTLHKLYIQLGDLHRYSLVYPASEVAYKKASYLAPGKGNPYNQLAVISQLKESKYPLPALALYWYCRSLLATHEPFHTSRANLERLLVANKNWIKQNVVKDVGITDDTVKSGQTVSPSVKFLSLFVDYHGVLFAAHMSNAKFDTSKRLMATRKELQKLMKFLTVLLTKSAFSDGLLLKMVSVNAFSVWNGLSCKERSLDMDGYAVTLALSMSFRFGAQLAQHVGVVVEKAEAKQGQSVESGGCTTIRLLAPLLLLCEFMSEISLREKVKRVVDDLGSQSTELLQDSEREFWSNIAELGNVCEKSSLVSKLLMENQAVVRDESFALPCDLKPIVKGYEPFSFFQGNAGIKSKEINDSSEYVSPEVAIEALELYPESQSQVNQSQRSKKSTVSTERNPNKSPADTRIKLSRFMAFVSKHIESGDLERTDDGIEWGSHSDLAESNEGKSSELDMEVDSRDEKDSFGRNENGGDEDVLVYKTGESGKPALLVPTALLNFSDMDDEKEDELLEKSTQLLERTSAFSKSEVQSKELERNDFNLLAPSSFNPKEGSNSCVDKEVETHHLPENERKEIFLNSLNHPMPQAVPLKPPPGFAAPSAPVQIVLPTPPIADSGVGSIQAESSFLQTPFRSGGIFKSDALRTPHEHSMSALPTLTLGNDQRILDSFAPLPSAPPSATRIPQTMNPFYLPPMVSENGTRNELSNEIGFLPSTSQGFNQGHQIQDPAAPLLPPFNTSVHNNRSSDQNLMDVDVDVFDQHDMFGLRSLGIFGDEKYSDDSPDLRSFNSQSQGNNQLPQTQNPFAFR